MSNITGNINEFKLNDIFELVKYYHISNPIQPNLTRSDKVKFQYHHQIQSNLNNKVNLIYNL